MAYINHLYVTFKGSWRIASMVNESWQFGIRYLPALEAGDVLAAGEPLGQFQAADFDDTRQTTEWDITTNYIAEGGGSDIDPKDLLGDQIGPAAKALMENVNALISDEILLREITCYPIGDDGKVMKNLLGVYKAMATNRVEINGANTGSILPPQCALSVGLQTASTGRRGHGRFYLPPMGAASLNAQEASMSNAVRNAVQTAVNSFIQDTCLDGDPVTRPIVTGVPWSLYYAVTGTRLGVFQDTQKRRRKSVDENYTSVALTF